MLEISTNLMSSYFKWGLVPSMSVRYVPLTVEIADNFMIGKNIAFDRVSRKIKWLDTSCKIQILIPLVLLKLCDCIL